MRCSQCEKFLDIKSLRHHAQKVHPSSQNATQYIRSEASPLPKTDDQKKARRAEIAAEIIQCLKSYSYKWMDIGRGLDMSLEVNNIKGNNSLFNNSPVSYLSELIDQWLAKNNDAIGDTKAEQQCYITLKSALSKANLGSVANQATWPGLQNISLVDIAERKNSGKQRQPTAHNSVSSNGSRLVQQLGYLPSHIQSPSSHHQAGSVHHPSRTKETRQPAPSKRLTYHDFAKIKNLLSTDVVARWETLAVQLGFKGNEVSIIKGNPMNIISGPHSYFFNVIDDWSQWSPGDGRGSKERANIDALKKALERMGISADIIAKLDSIK
ncbi:hypothetical protein L2734_18295 [Parashewanella spongiae]|uniref:hypothetical protein n=1 Tax=Parashewanella spongiae TaxID=342950 RepID=UPI00200C9D04|nr:hypothetical protein [Parashewanella spongiae]MCL1080080.1 hypothetical protein [Parashewanella spongiae]